MYRQHSIVYLCVPCMLMYVRDAAFLRVVLQYTVFAYCLTLTYFCYMVFLRKEVVFLKRSLERLLSLLNFHLREFQFGLQS